MFPFVLVAYARTLDINLSFHGNFVGVAWMIDQTNALRLFAGTKGGRDISIGAYSQCTFRLRKQAP